MKKHFLMTISFLLPTAIAFTQGKVGIGTSVPSAGLHIVHNDGFIAKGTYGIGNNLTETGGGTKMIWYPKRSAFRVGTILANYWDLDSIGHYSFGSGYDSKATGDNSIAMGGYTRATGFNAVAMGWNTEASGVSATALGVGTIAKAYSGVSVGILNEDNDSPAGNPSPNDRIFQIGNGDIYSFIRSNALTVLRNGYTGIGVLNPQETLSIKGGMNVDQTNLNTGTVDNILSFGDNSGEGIGSKRNSGTGQYGLGFYTNGNKQMSIANGGTVQVANNLTVQNGKGIIRNSGGTQLKKLSANVTVNTSFAAGETKTFAITWPENFSGTPEAYVGNVVSGTGGWAEVIMSISNTSATGATLYVYNPRTTGVSPNFTIKVIALGAE